jgi:hypothetical protein
LKMSFRLITSHPDSAPAKYRPVSLWYEGSTPKCKCYRSQYGRCKHANFFFSVHFHFVRIWPVIPFVE